MTEHRHPIDMVGSDRVPVAVRLLGGGDTAAALAAAGASVGGTGVTVVGEDALDDAAARVVRDRLEAGEVVIVLAQAASAASLYPVEIELEALRSAWGSTVLRSTDHGAVPSLPRGAVLVAGDFAVEATDVAARMDGEAFPDTPVVIAHQPEPRARTGTVLGSHAVGAGRLVICQYRLASGAVAGDAAACALLADILRWAARPRPVMTRQSIPKDDGRALTAYSWTDDVAR